MDNSRAMCIAETNFERHLQQNPYPGRGLVVGQSSVDESWLVIYWIMGRSPQSQNRRFVSDRGSLRTEPVALLPVTDTSLTIYEAMLELSGIYLVSNGDQTRTLYETLKAGGTFDDAMLKREHEPDPPHYTPRISAMLQLRNHSAALTLSILKASPANALDTDRYTFRPSLPPRGFGVGLTTYCGEATPLPSFHGDPLLLPCEGDAREILSTYWNALNPEYRVAIAVKWISTRDGSSEIFIENRF